MPGLGAGVVVGGLVLVVVAIPVTRGYVVRRGLAVLSRRSAHSLPATATDYLGHEKVSMTQDVYMSRKSRRTNAAHALDAFRPN